MAGKQEQISLDELIGRCEKTASGMKQGSKPRLVLLNAAAVLGSLGRELQKAWQETNDLRIELDAARHPAGPVLILPGRGEHRVN